MFIRLYKRKSAWMLAMMLLISFGAMAAPKAPSAMSNPLAQMLVFIMVLLVVAIGILANVVNSAAGLYRDKLRKEREDAQQAGSGTGILTVIALVVGGLLMSLTGFAQAADAAAAAAPAAVETTINGLSPLAFYVMVSVIGVEILILIALVYQLKFLIGIESKRIAAAQAQVAKPRESWWWKINKAGKIEEEKDLDLSHDYDGIRELDNKLPPWWIAAFLVTILFSVVYLWRYHVSHSAPLQLEELAQSVKQAEIEKAAYLAKSGSNVDENSVKMLDASGIASGQALFSANCVPCHGAEGQGAPVGPNLSDKYWIHGGTINDVFKTIKYGVIEKGMRPWKDDFSPIQLAQLASYVRSLQGTNPANPKEPQGQLYEEGQPAAPAATDSSATAAAAVTK